MRAAANPPKSRLVAWLLCLIALAIGTQSVPVNNECQNAISLELDGMIVLGSTVNATFKTVSCAEGVARGKGTFYSIVGTGKRLRVSTCTDKTEFDAYPAVFYQPSGGPCGDSMVCPVPVEDDTPCEEAYGSMYAWDTVAGELYIIFLANSELEGRYGLYVGRV
jgi:hypothetical protein